MTAAVAAGPRKFCLTAEAAAGAGVDRIGGKADGLARLVAAGARVPPFFVVTCDAFAVHAAKVPTPDRTAIERHPMPLQVTAEIEAALAELGAGPWAVRSSMVGEDSAAHSFAGQLDTFLFQKTPRDVLSAVVRCWGSAFGERALVYRERAGETGLPRIAVVVQRMIAGSVSGVVFSAHPITGRRDHCLVTATWGAGEGLVSGLCNADEFVVDASGQELEAKLADKDRELIGGDNGTVERDVGADRRHARCLDPARTRELALEVRRIADAFGAPQDVEWTFADQIYLLQARPITALPPPREGERVVWDNSNIQESYCGVTTPLTFSFARNAYANVYEQLFTVLGLSAPIIASHREVLGHLLGLVGGRVYYNINNWYRGLLILPGFGKNKQDMERMMGLDSPVDFVEDQRLTFWQKLARVPRLLVTLLRLKRRFARIDELAQRFLADFEAAYRRIDRKEMARASLARLKEIREQVHREMLGNWDTPIINDFYVMMSNGRLRRLVERHVSAADAQRLLPNLMSGEEGIASTEPTRALLRMARDARADAAVASAIRSEPPSIDRIRAASANFAARLDDYIERFGDRCIGELKLETISLREDPTFLVHMLRNYLDRPDLDADAIAERERELRATAEQEMGKHLTGRGRRRLRSVLAHARKAVKYRENMRLARTRGFGIYRDLHRAIGQRLFEAGKLDAPRDIFYLTVQEIEGLYDGTTVSADLRGLVAARKHEFAAYESLDMPHRFETIGPVHVGNRFVPPAPKPADRSARLLRGTGCYPGVVEAPARVILSPKDDLSVNGRVLVTLRTDPGWAPLFPTASGILVERGSTLSHSAILARELGIPAIVGVPDLLKIVQDGERLRLDGGAGTIERLDSK